jgi:hypothetical protein
MSVRCFALRGISLVAILVAISAGVVSPSEPGFGGRVEEIENVQMTISRRAAALFKFTKGTIGHLSKRVFQLELNDDHEACQLIQIINPDFGPCETENKRLGEQTDLVVSPDTNTTKLLDPAIYDRPLSKPSSMGTGHPSDVRRQESPPQLLRAVPALADSHRRLTECTFETGLCSMWMQDTDDTSDWTLGSEGTPTSYTALDLGVKVHTSSWRPTAAKQGQQQPSQAATLAAALALTTTCTA